MMARSMIGMSSVYLGPALLDLASGSGSGNENDENENKKKIWGTSPGALLTNLAAVSGLVGCIFLPLAGSILDHTSYRRAVGYTSAIVLWALKGMEIFLLRPSIWLWLLPMQVILAMAFNIHLMAVYAYVAELSSDPTIQAGYNATFGIVLYLASLFLLVGVLIGSAVLSTNDTGTAQIALTMTTIACLVGFGISWGSNNTGFPDRPALHPMIPPHQNIATAGYRKLAATIKSATQPARSVLLAVAFGEAARSALISVSTTVMKVTLQMNADESKCKLWWTTTRVLPIHHHHHHHCCRLRNTLFFPFSLSRPTHHNTSHGVIAHIVGLVFLAVLLAGIPGNKMGEWLTKRSRNPVTSIGWCNVWFMASTAGAARTCFVLCFCGMASLRAR
jgi:MFS family permease